MISASRTSDFQISGSAISSHKNIHKTLAQYSEFVGVTRKFTAGENHVETALANAVDYCIKNGILADFLRKNRAEVLGMILEEFDEKNMKEPYAKKNVRMVSAL